jgi:pilus assembly protein Flp/PilA
MYSFIKTWLALNSDKRAVTALEYGLIAAVIAGVTAVAFSGIGTNLTNVLGGVNTSI